MASIYFVTEHKEPRQRGCKIGVSGNVTKRMLSLQMGNKRALYCPAHWPIGDVKSAFLVETLLHEVFKDFRLKSEWFNVPWGAAWDALTFVHWHLTKHRGAITVDGKRYFSMSQYELVGPLCAMPALVDGYADLNGDELHQFAFANWRELDEVAA